ncbi:putative cytochrome P450 6a14 [Rhynchophorus ferrugineus]|uniref:putative cytochrome P450 6a14 n=1 Tax=Rhynchophorus ferrugineus TaxID=354439 RepID=UPI003FCD648F
MLIIVLVAGVTIGFVSYLIWLENYWKRRGIHGIKTDLLFGNIKKLIVGKKPFPCSVLDRYRTLKGLKLKHGGIFTYTKPTYIPIDPVIIKHILQADARHFLSRGLYHTPADILSMNLLNLEGERWKCLRAKLSPTFTSGKIKIMHQILLEKAELMAAVVGKSVDDDQLCDIKDVLSRYTIDIIGNCAFGIESDSLQNVDDIFIRYGKKIFERSRLKLVLLQVLPWNLLAYLGYRSEGRDISRFFSNFVARMIDYRKTNAIYRKDFLQLMLDTKIDDHGLTLEEITAQAYIFFTAGFETSSNALQFALLELAGNPEIQDKLRGEIEEVLSKYHGQLVYEAVQEMVYLDKVVKETLRKYPATAALPRVCTKDYKIPGTGLLIEEGVRVQIPIYGIHMDPEYYPQPEQFNPENFNEENKAKRLDCSFLPFGEGPRICIGMKFGLLQVKIGLVTLIRQFVFVLNNKTIFPVNVKDRGGLLTIKEDIWFDIRRI